MVPRMSASAPLDYLELDPAGHPRVENKEQAFSRTALSFEVIPPRHDADQKSRTYFRYWEAITRTTSR